MSLAHKFKLVFFSPAPNTRGVLDHLFNTFLAHVGKIGNYQRCAFLTRGTGQFAPTADANPTIGQLGKLEQVEEDRVEVHPYEEVAYDVYRLEDY
ncbi:putative GTP cyclohydrolase 1 type 2 [Favolaschia claudopus]|uniref:ATP phosphoribosyltransferase n=1 Tax=Favolaschia claudopus TaxID=2862362 RepID=A0AAV9ZTX9_9AGAR